MYVRAHMSLRVRMYVCMYVCMYVRIRTYVCVIQYAYISYHLLHWTLPHLGRVVHQVGVPLRRLPRLSCSSRQGATCSFCPCRRGYAAVPAPHPFPKKNNNGKNVKQNKENPKRGVTPGFPLGPTQTMRFCPGHPGAPPASSSDLLGAPQATAWRLRRDIRDTSMVAFCPPAKNIAFSQNF